jgi:trehalose 6-phosphate phosphatase
MDQIGPTREAMAPFELASGRALRLAADWALFLDVDGTLLDIAETPDAVEVSDHLRAVLGRVAPLLGGALALISGRPIAQLDRLFAPLSLPAAGLHGLEHRDAAGRTRILGEPEMLDGLRTALEDFAADHAGAMLEDKGRALALHYRRAPESEAAARELVAQVTAGRERELRVVDGKMVLEIKPRLADKGAAVELFMAEVPFAGRRPVFIGDDVTDEDAFAVVNRLGGHSIRVGELAGTSARHTLPDVEAVVDWLEALPGALGGSPEPGA